MTRCTRRSVMVVFGLGAVLVLSMVWLAPLGAATSAAWPTGKTVASGTLSDGSSWYLDAGETPGCVDIKMSVGMGNGVSKGCGPMEGPFRVSAAWTESLGSAAGIAVVVAPSGTKAVRVTLPEHGRSVTRIVRSPRRAVGDVVVFVSELTHDSETQDIVVHKVS